jgi:hypothetical protein
MLGYLSGEKKSDERHLPLNNFIDNNNWDKTLLNSVMGKEKTAVMLINESIHSSQL